MQIGCTFAFTQDENLQAVKLLLISGCFTTDISKAMFLVLFSLCIALYYMYTLQGFSPYALFSVLLLYM